MENKIYDKLKYFLQIIVPALVALIAGLGQLFGFDTSKIIGLITLLATFGGSVLGISNLHYKAGDFNE